ncbi:DUF1127 domain-containing protein [Roseibium polysiphoniae]|uniref:DUF1127 domain-containing protein n=2 Tax=Roseibium polysiphoniae TaxID=2571221 RepID=A0ABR9CCI0_9HYPH|nr:DUF1127 domain-containing protein [Roseibium polysiphoniae]MBD8877615.1 DUF1127 domain-containing protein [Roseibium polysiphoniae]
MRFTVVKGPLSTARYAMNAVLLRTIDILHCKIDGLLFGRLKPMPNSFSGLAITILKNQKGRQMALSHAASPIETISSIASSLGRSFLETCESIGRARAAKVLYADLAGMSDEELANLGLKRDEISQTVYAKIYDHG